ncbi:MAG: malto-oligosyltrehalose trehalohydrolase [Candidatus Promineifilaceae bacterium]|nr:malto-oligosyltrehalose trehalohydrolase [Candidatus Promineifilaceae bacterium]
MSHTFTVWAPRAKKVELELAPSGGEQGERVPMSATGNGWWAVVAEAEPGDDYAFRLDGGKPLPDPRSPWQPYGVHGASRLLDHGAFPWTDAGWQPPPLAAAVVYELHIGTFTAAGTFEGAIERLEYLRALGVTHVQLMPVAESPGERGWGYDGVDLFAPEHSYGGPEGLKRLVDACHERGLAVLLDVVYNHLGPDGNYLAQFGPYFTDRYHTPWGDAVNLDGPGSDEVRSFFIDNALMWLGDYHFDGLRLDAVHALLDQSAVHFLEEMANEVRALEAALGRRLVLIAESDLNDPRLLRPPLTGGYGLDAQWNDDFHHALHALLTGERRGYYEDFGEVRHLARALEQAYVYTGQHSPFRGRRHGRPPTGLNGDCFLGYLQNHDQIGNRAQGERIGHLIDRPRLKVGAALVLTAPFVPLLFQGEEWAASSPFLYFTHHQDEALAETVRKGRQEEFGTHWDRASGAELPVPDPQAEATFTRSKLHWEERREEPHAEMLAWHRALIALRAAQPALRDPRLAKVDVRYDEAAQWLVLARGPLRVVANLAERAQTAPLAGADGYRLLLASTEDVTLAADGVTLPGPAVAILAP